MIKRLSILIILICFFFIACNKKEIDIAPGVLYSVTTTEGDGFITFERKADGQWRGVYYISKGQLIANKRIVDLKVGDELVLVDEIGQDIPIIRYSHYEAPEFKDYPKTWTYKDSTYTVSIKKDVVYGNAQGYWVSYPDSGGTYQEIFNAKLLELKQGKKEIDLTMDIYLPNDNNEASRPLLVFIHGGAFFNGDKEDSGFPDWANYFAGLGYVVASVNYRLGFKKSLASVKRASYRGVQDVDAAIRYIVHNNRNFHVDPERVFVAGTSAGGITALSLAFMRNEDIPSDAKEEGEIGSVNPDMRESYTIRAVGNMWGAVYDLSILNNASSSVISFHSTGDPVVPYGKGHPFENVFLNWLLFPNMFGSEQITKYLGGNRAVLNSYELPGYHTLHIDKDKNGEKVLNSRFYEIETAMRDFFSGIMLPSPIEVKHRDNSQTFTVSSSDLGSVFWRVEGGVIMKLSLSDCRADILLFPDALKHEVIVCGKYKSGLSFRYKWSL